MINSARRSCLPLFLSLWWCGSAFAVPVIPGGVGFGIDTPAGRGGKVFRVTTLQESGTGSLKACIEASGPRVCVFEISGIIDLTANLFIRNPNITIAGQTAPAPGITLRGAGLVIRASDVLVQHIAIRPGDAEEGPDPSNRDAIFVSGPSEFRNVVIANCSFSWSIDEIASADRNWNNVTFINNIFSEPLHDSLHPKSAPMGNGLGHGFGVLLGAHPGRISMIGNLIAHSVSRNPFSGAGELVFVNNVVYNARNRGLQLRARNEVAILSSIVGNVFIDGPDSGSNSYGRVYLSEMLPGTKIFLQDNFAPEVTDDPWSIVRNSSSIDSNKLAVGSAPTWPTGLTPVAGRDKDVIERVLASVGPRPAERDVVDARIIHEVRTGTGGFVNCVAPDGTERCARNGGGWPPKTGTRRALELPASPSSDDNGNGYTNMEEFLHEMARIVEGHGTSAGPRPPQEVDVQ